MSISRRELLRRASALGAATVLPACGDDGETPADESSGGTDGTGGSSSTSATTDVDASDTDPTTGMVDGSSTTSEDDGLPEYEYEGDPGPEDLFTHGVASGDPLLDSVILWSRVTGAPEGSVEAFYEVALDPEFSNRVAADYLETTPDRDYTIKLDLDGLEPGTTYYYRFYSLGRVSPIGRTRTAPQNAERLRVAVASCSSLAHGYFHAYRRISERADLDLVVHLGDYIYEYATGGYGDVRPYEPETEILTLADYRMRYAQYRRDEDLQALHRQHPVVAVWDDHETANNAWSDGAENHTDGDEGEYADRKDAAFRSYIEWMPIREGAEGIIYRSLGYGDLLQLVMLDTRIVGRDEQVVGEGIDDPDRQLLGEDQEAWLEQTLDEPGQWKLIGQQVMVAHLQSGDNPFNVDQWDGYRAARQRFFDIIRMHEDVVVITGDIHSSWAFELSDDPFMSTDEPLAVEFVCPSVTSPGFPSNSAMAFMALHPHMRWGELISRGYMLLDVTPQRLQCSWWFVGDVADQAAGGEAVGSVWSVASGSNRLTEDDAPAGPAEDAPALAP